MHNQLHDPVALPPGWRHHFTRSRRLSGSQSRSGRFGLKNNVFLLPGIEPEFLTFKAHSVVVSTRLFQLIRWFLVLCVGPCNNGRKFAEIFSDIEGFPLANGSILTFSTAISTHYRKRIKGSSCLTWMTLTMHAPSRLGSTSHAPPAVCVDPDGRR